MLVARLWQLAQSRVALPVEHRRPVFLYLDEFQEFLHLHTDLSDALVQARGLGLGLVLAHQNLDQLDRSTRSAVLANTGSKVLFRLDHDDAATMARRTGGDLTADNLSGLGAFEAYGSLLVNGEATRFGSLRTLPLPPPTGDPSAVHAASRAQWGVAGTETEDRLRRLVEGTDRRPSARAPIGQRRTAGGEP